MEIDELRALAIQTVVIPGFSVGKTIEVKLQKPRILALMGQGKIPNPLMPVATKMTMAPTKRVSFDAREAAQLYELYCSTCLVEPTYDEFKDIITDEQMIHIYQWAVGELQEVSSFRGHEKDGPNDHDGEGVQVQTE